jgi:glucan 1,3-beta-glucosidase
VPSDGGNQQYTVRNFNFNGQTAAAIVLLWDWGWTWQQISIYGTPIGILLQNPESKAVVPGSIYLMDSDFQNVGVAIQANKMNPDLSDTSVIVLDNIGMNGVYYRLLPFRKHEEWALDIWIVRSGDTSP